MCLYASLIESLLPFLSRYFICTLSSRYLRFNTLSQEGHHKRGSGESVIRVGPVATPPGTRTKMALSLSSYTTPRGASARRSRFGTRGHTHGPRAYLLIGPAPHQSRVRTAVTFGHGFQFITRFPVHHALGIPVRHGLS